MRHFVVLFIHLIATLARLLGPGGVRSLVAESLLLKDQLLIVNRSQPVNLRTAITGKIGSHVTIRQPQDLNHRPPGPEPVDKIT